MVPARRMPAAPLEARGVGAVPNPISLIIDHVSATKQIRLLPWSKSSSDTFLTRSKCAEIKAFIWVLCKSLAEEKYVCFQASQPS